MPTPLYSQVSQWVGSQESKQNKRQKYADNDDADEPTNTEC